MMDVTIVSREEWGAMPPTETKSEKLEELPTPVPHVIIKYHSKSEPCFDKDECIKMLKRLQDFSMNTIEHSDVDYNFYIGGDGLVYEGRGWTRIPVKEHEYAGQSMDICYLGNWDETQELPDEMSRAFRFLVEKGVTHNYISKDYDITELRLGPIPPPKKKPMNRKSIERTKRKQRKRLQK